MQEKIAQFMKDEGVVLVLSESNNGSGGTIFAASGGSYDPKRPAATPAVGLMPEHYNRIARLIEHNIPVKLEFDIKNKFYDDNPDSFNITGEIPGTGPHKDQLVMLGGHFDSWHGGTGATDNGAGSAVMIEAVRILKAIDVPMDRTVRIALWGGEEEGLLGSRAYVKEHFGDPQTMKLTDEQSKLSGYFNLDNGTGKIRGVYLQGNDMMRPIFRGVARAVQGSRRNHHFHPQHRRYRPPIVRCSWIAWIPVHSGSYGLRDSHASLRYGCLRSDPTRRPDAGCGDHCRLCL